MAFGTYAELKASVAAWLTRPDLTAHIPDYIRLAESEINARLRLLQMETAANLVITGETVAQPDGWLSSVRLYIDGNPRRELEYVTPFQAGERFAFPDTDSRTVAYTIEGTDFRFLPSAGAGGTGKLLYYKRFDALAQDADTNFVLTNYPGIYLFGALAQASAFIQDDERIALWAGAFEKQLQICEQADRKARVSGAPLRARAAVTP